MTFPAFPKIPRWYKTFTITEKIDGSNGLIAVLTPEAAASYGITGANVLARSPDGLILAAGSRKRWLTPQADNFGFAAWLFDHSYDAFDLGAGLHYGEWYGLGIQRGYGLHEKRFALFNTHRWSDEDARPTSFDVVPVLWQGSGDYVGYAAEDALERLAYGSVMVPGFRNPEGVMIYSHENRVYWKRYLENDRAQGKTAPAAVPMRKC